jgi:serine/threonine protein kinase
MLLEGQQYSHYRLVRLLKQGGMGQVYQAEDTSLQRQVAIKVIRTDFAQAADQGAVQEAAQLFAREARAIAQLDHPHILPLYDSGEEYINATKVMYMVMPLRPEGSFADWLRTYTGGVSLPLAGVERVVRQAAEALQHAHDREIIHKDVKPSNFLVREHTDHLSQLNLQLADFGVAKVMRLTSDSQVIRGTPGYMAPEQWNGHPVPATDQYALAVMAYELLTGHYPFKGRGYQQLWYQHTQMTPVPPSTINPSIPHAVDEVLLRALAKNPASRFPSITAFARAFRQAVINSGQISHTLKISSFEAQRGINKLVTLPDGRQITVSVPAGVSQGQVIRMENYGHPTTYDGPKGALLVSVAIAPFVGEMIDWSVDHIAPTVPFLPPTEKERPSRPPFVPTPQPPSSTHRSKRPLKFVGLLGFLALTIISCSALFTRMQENTISNAHAIATFSAAGATATKTAAQANATATESAVSASTATAQTQATMTIQQANPYPSYLPGSGQLALYDPLKDDSKGYQWLPPKPLPLPPANGNCVFKNAGLDASVNGNNNYVVYFHPCITTNTDFSDFAYEVHMTLLAGDCGGVSFRGRGDAFYYFVICQDGRYRVVKYMQDPGLGVTPTPSLNPVLRDLSSQFINMSLNQDNLITIWAKGSTIKLYVNEQLIDTIQDPSYSTGQIGVLVKSWNLNTLTEAVFSDARVWNLQ